MPETNFWISSAAITNQVLRLTGHNRSNHLFEILARKHTLKGPVDFDNQNWDEGTFLAWDGDDLWHIEVILTIAELPANQKATSIPDNEFNYSEYGLSPIVFSQITGAIVANL